MSFSILYFSERALATAEKLGSALETKPLKVPSGRLSDSIEQVWEKGSILIMICSTGIAVRGIAPFLRDKATDPAVIVVTEDGDEVIPLTGSHLAGGHEAALRIGTILGKDPVITTSSDRARLEAPDLLVSKWGWSLKNRKALTRVNSRLLDKGILKYWTQEGLGDPPFPPNYEPASCPEDADVIVAFKHISCGNEQVVLVPPCIVAGVGCRKNTSTEDILALVEQGLKAKELFPEALGEILTISEKMKEPGLMQAARELDVQLAEVPRKTLLSLEGPFTTSAAARHFDIPGVAEPCAASAGDLLGKRITSKTCTAAFSLDYRPPQGKLTILGTGPGDSRFLTKEAENCLRDADAVVGYHLYVDLLPPERLTGKLVERYRMGEEEKRVKNALALALKGYRVALVSGGDPVLFGLGALGLRHGLGKVPTEVIPGLSAAQVAGSRLGAPYTNGLVLISLSDYLQPWPSIEKALEGAAMGGLTVALYNPVKRDIEEKLSAVKRIFGNRQVEKIYIARQAGREDESYRAIDLSDLSPSEIDMRSLILIPGKNVEEIDGLLVDKRGYKSEKAVEGGNR